MAAHPETSNHPSAKNAKYEARRLAARIKDPVGKTHTLIERKPLVQVIGNTDPSTPRPVVRLTEEECQRRRVADLKRIKAMADRRPDRLCVVAAVSKPEPEKISTDKETRSLVDGRNEKGHFVSEKDRFKLLAQATQRSKQRRPKKGKKPAQNSFTVMAKLKAKRAKAEVEAQASN